MPIPKDPIKAAEWKLKQSESHQWQKGESHNNFGKHKSETTRKKIGNTLKKIYQTKENHPRWMGGISFEPYCQRFNKFFKNRVRAFFNFQCVECGTLKKEGLIVHHVNYDKMVCCNGTHPLFVTLCRSCHGKTIKKDRQYWEIHFTEMITLYYGGKCYFTENEMLNGGEALC
jgi:hypothetical protein